MYRTVLYYLLGLLNDYTTNIFFAVSDLLMPGRNAVVIMSFYLTEMAVLPCIPFITSHFTYTLLIYGRCLLSIIPTTLLIIVKENTIVKVFAIILETIFYCLAQVSLIKSSKKFHRSCSKALVGGFGFSCIISGVLGLVLATLKTKKSIEPGSIFYVNFIVLILITACYGAAVKGTKLQALVKPTTYKTKKRQKATQSEEYSQTASYSLSMFGESESSAGNSGRENAGTLGDDNMEDLSMSISIGSLSGKKTKIPQLDMMNRRRADSSDMESNKDFNVIKTKTEMLTDFRIDVLMMFSVNMMSAFFFTAIIPGFTTVLLNPILNKELQYSVYYLIYCVGTAISRSSALFFNLKNVKRIIFCICSANFISAWIFRFFAKKIISKINTVFFVIPMVLSVGHGLTEGAVISAVLSQKSGLNKRSKRESRYLVAYYSGGLISCVVSLLWLRKALSLDD